jgi:thiamine-phosphate pyrophosphorylase
VVEAGKINGAKIILNTDVGTVEKLDADGIHLSSNMLMKMNERPLPANKIVFAACHDIKQLQQAKKIRIDCVTLSPVLATKTHPDAIPLGWDYFSDLCKSVNIPVYALGGLSEEDLEIAMSYGAYGIAAINSLWNRGYGINRF